MNIGSIGNSPYSFYNSASRVNNRAQELSAELRIRNSEVSKETEVKDSPSSAAIYQREDYKGPQKTEVSTDNLYQKQMISDPHFAMERLAGKLFDKLPQILGDMKNIPMDGSYADPVQAAPSKIVISENNADYLERQAQNAALQDISLM